MFATPKEEEEYLKGIQDVIGELPMFGGSAADNEVVGKVTRDRGCEELDRLYPQYGIAKHKGYGTKAHMEALRQYGPAPIHRRQFIRFLEKS